MTKSHTAVIQDKVRKPLEDKVPKQHRDGVHKAPRAAVIPRGAVNKARAEDIPARGSKAKTTKSLAGTIAAHLALLQLHKEFLVHSSYHHLLPDKHHSNFQDISKGQGVPDTLTGSAPG